MVTEDNPAVKLAKVRNLVLGRVEELEEHHYSYEGFFQSFTEYAENQARLNELKHLAEEMGWKEDD